jgi:hypothetical protein
MNAADVIREATHLRRLLRAREEEGRPLLDERQRLRGVDPWLFRQADVDAVNTMIARNEQDCANIAARIAALEARLPSTEAMQLGKEQAASLTEQAHDAQAQFPTDWSEFMTALTTIEAKARRVAATAAKHSGGRLGVLDLRQRLALDVEPLDVLAVNTRQMKLAAAIGALIRDVAFNLSVDPATDAEVRAAETEAKFSTVA